MKWTNKGHQFDTLGNHLRQRNRIYIYGDAETGQYALSLIAKAGFGELVDGFLDRSPEKQHTGFLGKPVYSPDVIFEAYDENHLIVLAFGDQRVTGRVRARMRQAGYVEGWDFFRKGWFEPCLNDPFLPVLAMYVQNRFLLTSTCCIPSTRCNLNCRDCLNFTPHLEHFEDRPLEEVCADVDLLFRRLDFTYRFQISGGEPLLYPHFKELAAHIGSRYRDKIDVFETVLNGTVVPSDEICEVLAAYHMIVYLDDYRENLPSRMDRREEIIRQLERYGIQWIDNRVEEWFSLDIFHTDNSSMTDGELTEYFDHCNNPWHCYEHGRLYICNFARFAVKAGLNQEDLNDYFDLTRMTEEKKRELLEFSLNYTQRGYTNFCKRCAGWCGINAKSIPVAVQAERRRTEGKSCGS